MSDRVTTSGLLAAPDLAGLQAAGYDLLVNLLPDSSEHALEGEAAIVQDQGVGYVYIPVDFEAPGREQLDAFFEVMDAHAGKSIHVHCAANWRVSAFYGLYAIRAGAWSVEEADEHIRSIWDPATEPVWSEFIAAERVRLTQQQGA